MVISSKRTHTCLFSTRPKRHEITQILNLFGHNHVTFTDDDIKLSRCHNFISMLYSVSIDQMRRNFSTSRQLFVRLCEDVFVSIDTGLFYGEQIIIHSFFSNNQCSHQTAADSFLALTTLKYLCINHGDQRVDSIRNHQ